MAALLAMTFLLAVLALVVAVRGTATRFPDDVASFRCKLRPAPVPGLPETPWPRRRARGLWTHDVLLIREGRLRVRLRVLAVRTPEEPLRVLRYGEVGGVLGAGALAVVLRLDDGSLVEVAVRAADRTRLVGPFFAAAIPGLFNHISDRRRP